MYIYIFFLKEKSSTLQITYNKNIMSASVNIHRNRILIENYSLKDTDAKKCCVCVFCINVVSSLVQGDRSRGEFKNLKVYHLALLA